MQVISGHLLENADEHLRHDPTAYRPLSLESIAPLSDNPLVSLPILAP
jgi:hypothetical protein